MPRQQLFNPCPTRVTELENAGENVPTHKSWKAAPKRDLFHNRSIFYL